MFFYDTLKIIIKVRNFCALPHNYDGMQCDTGLNTCQCNKSLTALTYNNWLFLLCYYLSEESYPAVRLQLELTSF